MFSDAFHAKAPSHGSIYAICSWFPSNSDEIFQKVNFSPLSQIKLREIRQYYRLAQALKKKETELNNKKQCAKPNKKIE